VTEGMRHALREIVDLKRRLEVQECRHRSELAAAEARIAKLERALRYAERDKKAALTRAQKANDQARHWHGIALRFAPALAKKEAA
jgi:type II secretory pathway component PulJ